MAPLSYHRHRFPSEIEHPGGERPSRQEMPNESGVTGDLFLAVCA